jgi:Xaa-Pro aminopeptidase
MDVLKTVCEVANWVELNLDSVQMRAFKDDKEREKILNALNLLASCILTYPLPE